MGIATWASTGCLLPRDPLVVVSRFVEVSGVMAWATIDAPDA